MTTYFDRATDDWLKLLGSLPFEPDDWTEAQRAKYDAASVAMRASDHDAGISFRAWTGADRTRMIGDQGAVPVTALPTRSPVYGALSPRHGPRYDEAVRALADLERVAGSVDIAALPPADRDLLNAAGEAVLNLFAEMEDEEPNMTETETRASATPITDRIRAGGPGPQSKAERQEWRAEIDAMRAAGKLYGERAGVEGNALNVPVHGPARKRNPWAARNEGFTSDSDIVARSLDAVEIAESDVMPDSAREMVTRSITSDPTGNVARWALASSDPDYLAAFRAVIRRPMDGYRAWSDPQRMAYLRAESARTAMGLTDTNGGYMVPFTLDPTVILTNSGTANSFRQVARQVVISTDTWNGVASSGVNAEWLAEAAEAADASPTFTQPAIKAEKLAAWVFGSYEVLSDSGFGDQVGMLFADAVSNLEAPAFTTGDGNGKPKGVITAVAAVPGSMVASATDSAFAVADVYKVAESLPARYRRSGNVAWMCSLPILNAMRGMVPGTGQTESLVRDGANGPTVLGMRVLEASDMASDPTVAATDNHVLILGDWSRFVIVNRLGSTVIYEPLVKGSNGRPTGQAGFYLYARVGSGVTDPNGFRLLKS